MSNTKNKSTTRTNQRREIKHYPDATGQRYVGAKSKAQLLFEEQYKKMQKPVVIHLAHHYGVSMTPMSLFEGVKVALQSLEIPSDDFPAHLNQMCVEGIIDHNGADQPHEVLVSSKIRVEDLATFYLPENHPLVTVLVMKFMADKKAGLLADDIYKGLDLAVLKQMHLSVPHLREHLIKMSAEGKLFAENTSAGLLYTTQPKVAVTYETVASAELERWILLALHLNGLCNLEQIHAHVKTLTGKQVANYHEVDAIVQKLCNNNVSPLSHSFIYFHLQPTRGAVFSDATVFYGLSINGYKSLSKQLDKKPLDFQIQTHIMECLRHLGGIASSASVFTQYKGCFPGTSLTLLELACFMDLLVDHNQLIVNFTSNAMLYSLVGVTDQSKYRSGYGSFVHTPGNFSGGYDNWLVGVHGGFKTAMSQHHEQQANNVRQIFHNAVTVVWELGNNTAFVRHFNVDGCINLTEIIKSPVVNLEIRNKLKNHQLALSNLAKILHFNGPDIQVMLQEFNVTTRSKVALCRITSGEFNALSIDGVYFLLVPTP